MNIQPSLLVPIPFVRHPVAQYEAQYQNRIMENTRAGNLWVGLAYLMTYPAMLLSIAIYLGALASQIIPQSVVLSFDHSTLLLATGALIFMIAMNIALYTVVSLVTFGLAVNSISREKQGKTWDMLLLTGVDGRQLVWGKWWATVLTFWKDFALVWLMRLGMIAWLIAVTDGEFIYRPVIAGLSPEFVYLFLAAIMIAVLTLFDSMLTAALGQITALSDRRTGAIAFIAFGLRLVAQFAPLVLPVMIYIHFEMHEASFYMGFWAIWLLIYAALIGLLLMVGQWLAVRQHALSPTA